MMVVSTSYQPSPKISFTEVRPEKRRAAQISLRQGSAATAAALRVTVLHTHPLDLSISHFRLLKCDMILNDFK